MILLKVFLEQNGDRLKLTNQKMLNKLSKKFYEENNMFDNENLFIATYLDPRYKMTFFPIQYRQKIENRIEELLLSNITSITNKDISTEFSNLLNTNLEVSKPAYTGQHSISDSYEQLISFKEKKKPQNVEPELSGSKRCDKMEIEMFTTEPVIKKFDDPIKWWEINKNYFPNYTKLAIKYLSAPLSSIYSERAFSEAYLLYEEKRICLRPDKAGEILFIKHSLKFP